MIQSINKTYIIKLLLETYSLVVLNGPPSGLVFTKGVFLTRRLILFGGFLGRSNGFPLRKSRRRTETIDSTRQSYSPPWVVYHHGLSIRAAVRRRKRRKRRSYEGPRWSIHLRRCFFNSKTMSKMVPSTSQKVDWGAFRELSGVKKKAVTGTRGFSLFCPFTKPGF